MFVLGFVVSSYDPFGVSKGRHSLHASACAQGIDGSRRSVNIMDQENAKLKDVRKLDLWLRSSKHTLSIDIMF